MTTKRRRNRAFARRHRSLAYLRVSMDDLRRLPAVWRALVVLAAVGASAALAASAQAGGPAQPVSSAIAQYVEMIPTGEGVQAAGVGAPGTTKVPPKIARQIRTRGRRRGHARAGGDIVGLWRADDGGQSAGTGRPSGGRPSEGSERRCGADRAGGATRCRPPRSLTRSRSRSPSRLSGGFASVWLGLVIVTAAAFVAARRGRGSPRSESAAAARRTAEASETGRRL